MTSPALPSTGWRKSTFSGADNCIEVKGLGEGSVAIRDSKVPHGDVLVLSRPVFVAFMQAAKRGDFDDLC